MDVKDLNNYAPPLPGEPEQWPTEWRDLFQEREAIMLESHVPDARQKAIADIQPRAQVEIGRSIAEKLKKFDGLLKVKGKAF